MDPKLFDGMKWRLVGPFRGDRALTGVDIPSGLKDSRHIGAVIVHPTNPYIVFVAAMGHVYGPTRA